MMGGYKISHHSGGVDAGRFGFAVREANVLVLLQPQMNVI